MANCRWLVAILLGLVPLTAAAYTCQSPSDNCTEGHAYMLAQAWAEYQFSEVGGTWAPEVCPQTPNGSWWIGGIRPSGAGACFSTNNTRQFFYTASCEAQPALPLSTYVTPYCVDFCTYQPNGGFDDQGNPADIPTGGYCVPPDNDNDGIPDSSDPDDDNDGDPDTSDPDPFNPDVSSNNPPVDPTDPDPPPPDNNDGFNDEGIIGAINNLIAVTQTLFNQNHSDLNNLAGILSLIRAGISQLIVAVQSSGGGSVNVDTSVIEANTAATAANTAAIAAGQAAAIAAAEATASNTADIAADTAAGRDLLEEIRDAVDVTASGGEGCDAPPVCSNSDPVGCQLLQEAWRGRCMKGSISGAGDNACSEAARPICDANADPILCTLVVQQWETKCATGGVLTSGGDCSTAARPVCTSPDAVGCAQLQESFDIRCALTNAVDSPGDCSTDTPPVCQRSDVVQCAILIEEWRQTCAFTGGITGEVQAAADAFAAAVADEAGAIAAVSITRQVDASMFDEQGFLSGGACPPPWSMTVLGQSLVIDNSSWCNLLGALGWVLVSIAGMTALKIVYG